MAKRKQSSTPAPQSSTPAPSPALVGPTAKDRRRQQNEEAARRNAELRRLGKPTPWEEKRAARKAARAKLQLEHEKKVAARQEALMARDAREQREREAIALELLRQFNKGKARRVAGK